MRTSIETLPLPPSATVFKRIETFVRPHLTYGRETIGDMSTKYLADLHKGRIHESVQEERDALANMSWSEIREEIKRQRLPEASEDELRDVMPLIFGAFGKAIHENFGFDPHPRQIETAIALLDGKIAEMKMGEGKTIAIAHVAALRGLTHKGVHVFTANDSLAQRDVSNLGDAYAKLGLKVAVVLEDKDDSGLIQYIYDPEYEGTDAKEPEYKHLRRKNRFEAYEADIVYGAKGILFDYLRDRGKSIPSERVQQKGLNSSFVDEVDIIFDDEALMPNIISRITHLDPETHEQILQLTALFPTFQEHKATEKIPNIRDFVMNGDYFIAETDKEVGTEIRLGPQGYKKIEQLLYIENLHDGHHEELLQIVESMLKAYFILKKDLHYFVEKDEATGISRIVPIDPSTGRPTPDRRFDDNVHLALEAKEELEIKGRLETDDAITNQQFFKLYSHLGGTTGTAIDAAEVFYSIYGKDIISVPTRVESRLFLTAPVFIFESNYDVSSEGNRRWGKYHYILRSLQKRHAQGQPVLLVTNSVEEADELADLIKEVGLHPRVLHAKQTADEAKIVGLAGGIDPITNEPAITVATQIAGRGADIIVDEEINKLGGLHLIITSLSKRQRILQQAIARTARHGQNGSCEIFASWSDELFQSLPLNKVKDIYREWNLHIRPQLPAKASYPDDPMYQKWYDSWHQQKVAEYNLTMQRYQIQVTGFIDELQHIVTQQETHSLKQMADADEIISTHRRRFENTRDTVVSHPEKAKGFIINGLTQAVQHAVKKPLAHRDTVDIRIFEREAVEAIANIISLPDEDISLLLDALESENVKEQLPLTISHVYEKSRSTLTQLPKEVTQLRDQTIFLNFLNAFWQDHLTGIYNSLLGVSLRGERDMLSAQIAEAEKLYQDDIQDLYNILAAYLFPYPTVTQTSPALTTIDNSRITYELGLDNPLDNQNILMTTNTNTLTHPAQQILPEPIDKQSN